MDTPQTSPVPARPLSRRALLGTAGAGLALAGSSLLDPSPAGAAPARSTVRVATYNLNTNDASEVRADLDLLAGRVALLGLNECMGLEREAIADWVRRRPSWGWWRPVNQPGESRFKGSNAVLFDQRVFALEQRGAVFGSPSRTPEFAIDERWITWVRLTHRASGRKIVWIQTHMDPSVESGGRPRDGAGAKIEANLRYMRRLKELARQKAEVAEVLVGGDWNVDAKADRRVGYAKFPFAVLEEKDQTDALPGLRTTYSRFGFEQPATAGDPQTGKYIDDIALWTRRVSADRVVRFTDHNVLTGLNSDHRPLVAGLVVDHA